MACLIGPLSPLSLVAALALALALSMHVQTGAAQQNVSVSFIQSQFTFSVHADANVGTLIGVVLAGTSDLEGSIAYSISGNASRPFSITPADGQILLAERLRAEHATNYTFVARAATSQVSDRAIVTVRVTDVNDNAPVWEPIGPLSVSESTAPNTRIATLQATDADKPPNTDIHFAITRGNGDGLFSLNGDSLQLERRPDFEQRNFYTLTLSASDSGTPPLSSFLDLDITISDANEPPVIVAEPATVRVSEAAAVGTTLASINYADPDAGQLLRVTVEPAAFNDTFAVSKDGTRLITTQLLDAETRQRYDLTLIVADNGSPPLRATADITVLVSDVNEHAPRFHQSTFTATIPETQPVGGLVQRLQVIDDDALGHVTNYTFLMLKPYPSPFFRLKPGLLSNEVDVISISPLDYETRSSYELLVRATYTQIDGSTNSTDAIVRVIVEDSNDPPVFSQRQYHATVPYPVSAGTQVAAVSATDMEGDAVVFSLQGITQTSPTDGAVTLVDTTSFGIASIAGLIRTQTLNLVPGTYHLRVCARDAANKTSHVIVGITFLVASQDKAISLVEDESGSLDIRTADERKRVFINGADVLQRLNDLSAATTAATRRACKQGTFASQSPTGFTYPTTKEIAQPVRALAWDSAVVAPNGLVFATPTDATAVAIIDPATGSVDITTIAGFSSTYVKWGSAVLAGNGNIYAVPAMNSTMLVVDPDLRSASTVPVQMPAPGAVWRGAVLTATEKVCGIPWSSTSSILIFDPSTNTSDTTLQIPVTVVNGGWRSAVLAGNNKIYAPPRRAGQVLVIQPDVRAVSTMSVPGYSHSEDPKWQSALLAQNGLIYCVPSHEVDAVLIIDPTTATVDTTTINSIPLPGGTAVGRTAVLSPSGLIYGLPVAGDAVLVVNPDRSAYNHASLSVRNEGDTAYEWTTAVALPDGSVIALSRDGTAALVLNASPCAQKLVWP